MPEYDWLAERFEANRGHLRQWPITRGNIVAIDLVADPERLRQLDLVILND